MDRAPLSDGHSTIALHTQSAVVRRCRQHLATYAVSPSAVNNRPTPVVVYVTLVNAGCAVTKFSKYRVWDKVPDGSTLIFGDTLIISLKYSVAKVHGSPHGNKPA